MPAPWSVELDEDETFSEGGVEVAFAQNQHRLSRLLHLNVQLGLLGHLCGILRLNALFLLSYSVNYYLNLPYDVEEPRYSDHKSNGKSQNRGF